MKVHCIYEGKDQAGNVRRWQRPAFDYDDSQDPKWQDLDRQISNHYSIWLDKYNLAPMTATFTTD